MSSIQDSPSNNPMARSPVHAAARALTNPGIVAALLLSALLIVAAYQVRPTYDVPIGTQTDGTILRNFNTAEVMQGDNPLRFRWSRGESRVVLDAVGRQDFDVALTVSGSRPEGQPPAMLRVEVAGRTLLDVQPPPELTEYRFAVPRELLEDGTLDVAILSNEFIPPADPNPRPLGVVLTHVRVSPGAGADLFIEPPGRVLAAVLGAAGILAWTLSLLGFGAGGVFASGMAVGALAGALLVFDRLWLTSGGWYEVWPQAVLAGGVFVGLCALAMLGLLRGTPELLRGRAVRMVLALALLVFVVRLAGQLHPQIFIVDLGFHVHRFETVSTGQLLFTIESAEWAGRSTYYLPTAYIFMLPLSWLLNDVPLVVRLFTVGIGTLGGVVLYAAASRLAASARIGLTAAALYLLLPMAVLPYSWGITSNVFGEFFALCVFALLTLTPTGVSAARAWLWALVTALGIALVSHPGVAQLTGVAVASTIVLWWLFGRQTRLRRAAVWTAGASVVALLAVYVLYYVNVIPDMLRTLGEIRQARAEEAAGGLNLRVGGSVSDRSLGLIVRFVDNWGDWLTGGLEGFWNEARAYYRVWPIAGAGLGFMGLWFARTGSGRSPSDRLRALLVVCAWAVAVVLFALVGWIANLYVRYALFALPVVALGAGVLLGQLWRRGRWGAALPLLVVGYFAVEALVLWQYRINYGLK
ncbi:MAG TPA: hypothetical protein VFR15_11070 [Chloroflexia bacterium]|nr:hypothetical protein [Chloroflexia bacterium]